MMRAPGYEPRMIASGGTTWNPADADPDIAFSGGNLTITKINTTANASVRSTTSRSSGKLYFEHRWSSAAIPGGIRVGITDASTPVNVGVGSSIPSVGWAGNGSVINDSALVLNAVADLATVANQFMYVALDASGRLVWFKKQGGINWNDSGTANPATGVGGFALSGSGAIFAMGTISFDSAPDISTVNFGATAFNGTVPAGFSAWG